MCFVEDSLICAQVGHELVVLLTEFGQPFGVEGCLLFGPGDQLLGGSDRRLAHPAELLGGTPPASRVRRLVAQRGMISEEIDPVAGFSVGLPFRAEGLSHGGDSRGISITLASG